MMVPNAAAAVAASMGAEALSPHLYSVSQAGRRVVYGSQRRWIGLATGWTRLGAGATELDSRIATSQSTGPDLFAENAEAQGQAARALMAQLCEKFYTLGWAPGTGAGVTLRLRSPTTKEWRVFVTPSGLQKEDMIGEDMYELVSLLCHLLHTIFI
jgi:methylthioribulose 1-phosphate dehydratase/enolase-phosphatase E1